MSEERASLDNWMAAMRMLRPFAGPLTVIAAGFLALTIAINLYGVIAYGIPFRWTTTLLLGSFILVAARLHFRASSGGHPRNGLPGQAGR